MIWRVLRRVLKHATLTVSFDGGSLIAVKLEWYGKVVFTHVFPLPGGKDRPMTARRRAVDA